MSKDTAQVVRMLCTMDSRPGAMAANYVKWQPKTNVLKMPNNLRQIELPPTPTKVHDSKIRLPPQPETRWIAGEGVDGVPNEPRVGGLSRKIATAFQQQTYDIIAIPALAHENISGAPRQKSLFFDACGNYFTLSRPFFSSGGSFCTTRAAGLVLASVSSRRCLVI